MTRRFRFLTTPVLAAAILLAAGAVFFAQVNIDRSRGARQRPAELMYFPSAGFTRAATFGYDNLVADWIWLQIVQYYGYHSLSDHQYQYLEHMFGVLVSLTPRFVTAYDFGALLLATDGNDPSAAMRLMEQGIRQNPDQWAITFTRGFINYAILRDYREAWRWFTIASRQPGAPETAARFAAYIAQEKTHDLRTARVMWSELRKSSNKLERAIAQHYLDKIDREETIGTLQSLADRFYRERNEQIGSLQDLVSAGLIEAIPADPLGGSLTWDRSRHRVMAVDGHR